MIPQYTVSSGIFCTGDHLGLSNKIYIKCKIGITFLYYINPNTFFEIDTLKKGD